MPTATLLAPATKRFGKLAPIAVFLVGIALTGAFLAVVSLPSLRESLVHRYCCGHPIEECEVWLFFWGLSALAWKAWRLGAERRVSKNVVLPIHVGRTVGVAELPGLIGGLAKLPGSARATWYVRRLVGALSYVLQRGSASELEERLGVLADRDADQLEGSYELIRNITWAIPILGFLGTVVGITIAIANITPEQLQDSLDQVVGGLAVAFDTTALALALSMVLVLGKFLVERAEKGLLARVETAAEDTLLHSLEKHEPETQKFLGVVEGVAKVVVQATRDAWREQGQLWTKAIEQVGDAHVAALQNVAAKIVDHSGRIGGQLVADQTYQFADIVKRLEKLQEVGTATVRGLREVGRDWLTHVREAAHQEAVKQDTQFQHFLTGLETLRNVCHKSLAEVAAKMMAHQAAVKRQTDLIAQLVADEGRLSKFQQTMQNNLVTLASVQSLDEAIHSLSAAAHLLTARAGRVGNGPWLATPGDPPAKEAA